MASALISLVVVLVISAATTNVDASKCSPGWATCNNGRTCRTNVWNDPNNCGQCGSKCARPQATSKCKMGRCTFECDEKHGWCDCNGKHLNGCEVNSQTDKNNCGACGLVCPAPANFVASCVKGVCKKECKYGYKQCNNSCVKVTTDVNNCGGCGIVCHGGGNGTAFCDGGQCDVQCQTSYVNCNGECSKLRSDVLNCGGCGTECLGGASGTAECVGGSCDLDCASGCTKCNIKCVDLNADVMNCRSCGKECSGGENGTAVCVSGECEIVCNSSYTNCSGKCVIVDTDLLNCGDCGFGCYQFQQCQVGTCKCVPMMTLCNGTLVDIQGDSFNCGSCGFSCKRADNPCECGQCTQPSCFPGDAIVTLANGAMKRMLDLMLGDQVAVRGRNGNLTYEDVYAFGYQDASASASSVQFTLKPIDGDVSDRAAKSRTLELTAFHFVPVSTGVASMLTYKRARDVIVGDRTWADGSMVVEVTGISQVQKQGLYKLFTLGGTIIVNGVVASTHSEWFLDGVFEALGVVQWLPWAYQALLLPLRMIYYVLGKDAYIALYRWLDAAVDMAAFDGKHGSSIAMALAAVALFVMAEASRRV